MYLCTQTGTAQQQTVRVVKHRIGNCLWGNKDQDCDDPNFEIIYSSTNRQLNNEFSTNTK